MGAPTMDALPPPTEEEQAQLMALLQAYEQGMIGANDVPLDLKVGAGRGLQAVGLHLSNKPLHSPAAMQAAVHSTDTPTETTESA